MGEAPRPRSVKFSKMQCVRRNVRSLAPCSPRSDGVPVCKTMIWSSNATERPLSLFVSNDRSRHQCHCRSDEAFGKSRGDSLAQRTGPGHCLSISATLAELLYGIGSLPGGRRRDALAASLDGLLELFGRRILSFDAEAARFYAEIAIKARAAGKGFPLPDGYIAATAAVHGFAVATRDTGPF